MKYILLEDVEKINPFIILKSKRNREKNGFILNTWKIRVNIMIS